MGRRVGIVAACALATLSGLIGQASPPASAATDAATGMIVALPSPIAFGEDGSRLTGLVSLPDGERWAVGTKSVSLYYSFSSFPFVKHWDGSSWSAVPISMEGRTQGEVTTVASDASGDVVLAAQVWSDGPPDEYGDPTTIDREWLIERWTGSAFTPLAQPPFAVTQLVPSGPSDVTAIGIGGASRWDGSAWTTIAPAVPTTTVSAAAMDVDGTLWAAGWSSAAGNQLERWTGSVWETVPITPALATSGINVIAPLAGGGLALEGYYPTTFSTFDGTSVNDLPSPPPPNAGTTVVVGPQSHATPVNANVDIAGSSPNDVWMSDYGYRFQYHWDGRSWSSQQTLHQATLVVDGDGAVFAGGWSLQPLETSGGSSSITVPRGGAVWWHAGHGGSQLFDGSQLINTQMLPDATVPHRFRAAGTFQIAAGDAVTTVAVAPDLQPAVVDPGRTVALRWADGPSRARLADVEVLRPGAERWMLLRRDSTAAWAPITPDAGSGVYRFRVRVHRPDGPPSDWSPDASLRVRTSGVATPSWQPLAVLPAFGPGSTFTGAALSPDGTLWLGGSPMVAVSPLGQTRSVRTPINDDFDQSLLGVRGGVWSCNMYGVAHAVGAGPAQVMLGGHCAGITGSAGDVWALFVDTHPERVAHWHDGRWTTYRPAGVHGYLSSISSDGKGGLWAVGSRIWRFDGGRWRTMPGPAPGTSFMQVKAFAHSAILIGAAPGPEAPVMYRWDGRRWSVIRTYAWPQIVASSIRDVWVDFDHWDGRSWTTEPVAAMAEQANGRMVAYDRGQRTRLLQATPMHLGDDGFAIDRAWVVQGATTFWRVAPAATRGHRLIDASGLGLFDPGIHGPGSMVLLRFPAAGTYHVADSVSERVATVQVGIRVLDGRLGLASGTLPAGAGIDVQMQARGMAAFADWISDGSDPTVALPTAPGTYAFRSRLRDPATGAATGWSPVRTVTVV